MRIIGLGILFCRRQVGYEVAWKMAGADQYRVWNTDSNGNDTSMTGFVSGTSNTVESLETSFHRDLNGHGVTGLATAAIETNGSTSPTEVGNQYYLYNSGGLAPR